MDSKSQGFGPSSTAYPGHKQGAGWEVELPGIELAPMWDPGTFKARTYIADFFKKVYLFFIGKADVQRGGETERKIFQPMIHSPSRCNS